MKKKKKKEKEKEKEKEKKKQKKQPFSIDVMLTFHGEPRDFVNADCCWT